MNSNTMETYIGHIRTPADAIKLFEACRTGLLPRVQRRLSEKERQSIKSGSVFVWDEREAGMRRWTDGKSWSASRVSGSFLTYREMEGKRGGGAFFPAPTRPRVAGRTPDSGRGSDEDVDMDREGPDGYRYKLNGLMKQSFSITTSEGQHLHLISYYSRDDTNSHKLKQPTADEKLYDVVPERGMYPESTVQDHSQGPALTKVPMQNSYLSSSQQVPPSLFPQGYPRGPYPYQIPPGYNWPPSPVATPPYHYQVGSYSPQLQLPSSGYPHLSPHQGQQLVPQPTSSERSQPHQDPSLAPPTPQPLQRVSGPQQQQVLPLTPPSPHSLQGVSGPQQQQGPPVYASMTSPRVEQARTLAEQQAQEAQKLAQEHQQQMLQGPKIDPRIVGLPAQKHNGNNHNQQAGPTSTPRQDLGTANQTKSSSLMTNGSSSGSKTQQQAKSQNIPSISSMVHNHTPTPSPSSTIPDHARSVTNGMNGTTSRGGSASPKDAEGKCSTEGGPQDIPHGKLGFKGEDIRALRVLDRKFCT